jgi:thiol-disulfide isomerase/thioredoxin
MNPTQHLRVALHGGVASLGPLAEDSGAVLSTTPAAIPPAGDGALASLGRATAWLNSPPVTAAALRGHVVLVNFWTYTCINWLRTLPYLRAWAHRYQDHGLVVIGVHTPEFDFEHDLDNLRRATKDLRVNYPIAIDNDYAIWDAFGNRYWPALYLIDAHGHRRHHLFGEADYEQSERIIQRLLAESGAGGIGQDLVSVEATAVEVAADWDSLWSPENYLGSARTENFASPNGAVLGTRHVYGAPARLRLNHWALSGDWTVTRQAIMLHEAEGRITYRFHARDLHLVMAPTTPRWSRPVPGGPRQAAAGRRPRQRRRRPGQRHPHPAAAVPAGPPARPRRRAQLRGHLPGSRRPRLRLHLRLGRPPTALSASSTQAPHVS